MGYYYVNKTNEMIPIYNHNGLGAFVIAHLQPNHVCIHDSEDVMGNQRIYFRGADNELTGGLIKWFPNPLTPITECGLYKVDMYGKMMTVFRTRYETKLYDNKGKFFRTLPAYSHLMTQSGDAGSKHPEYMAISYYGAPEHGDPQEFDGFIDIQSNLNSDFGTGVLIGK